MKKLLLLLFALAGAVSANAQLSDGVSATLIDGDTTKVFYGYDSFRNAYAAAKQTGCTISAEPWCFFYAGVYQQECEGVWCRIPTRQGEWSGRYSHNGSCKDSEY